MVTVLCRKDKENLVRYYNTLRQTFTFTGVDENDKMTQIWKEKTTKSYTNDGPPCSYLTERNTVYSGWTFFTV